MTEIKRYEMNHRGLPSADHTGTWVLHEDHAAIVAEKDARIAALQEQVRALAAEISECRRFVGEELGPESGIQFAALSTERSDEVLREIRAQAVEEFCDLIKDYGRVEAYHFNPDFAGLYAKIYKGIYESILDNPAVHDMESLVDWLEAGASDYRAYADMAIKYAARIRTGEQP